MSESLKLEELNIDTSYKLNISEKSFFDQIKEINLLPFKNHKIHYSDSIWDFSKNITINVDRSKLCFNFNNIPNEFRDDTKKYILVQAIENQSKIQSFHRKFSCLTVFLNYLLSINIFHIEDVSFKNITDFFNTKENVSPLTKGKYKNAIANFYEFYSVNIKNILNSEIETFLADRNLKLIKAQEENNKYKDIPEEYFNNLMKCLINAMNSKTEPKYLKTTACLLIIESQTGLRASELGDLKTDALKEVTLYNGEKSYYLEYKTWKRESGNNTFTIEKTYVNELTKKAVDTLIDILKDDRIARKTDYLFFAEESRVLPLNTQRLRDNFIRFYFTHGKEIGCINCANKYPDLPTTLYKNEYIISYPATPQFRVHVCTELYRKGTPLKYIQEFIEENNYNIDTDVSAIADKLLEQIPIRAKTGGVCIISSKFRECSNDAMTNEFYCAYGVCPNIFHFYYMANVSYRQSKELVENIELSKKRNHMRQAEKECNMLNTIVSKKLLPELDELISVVNEKGKKYVVSNYEDLKNIVENIDDIYTEASLWKTLRIK